ncbi:glycosyltransferase family 4 protein [Pyxidicoccus xibeiensis]|uniref:glycosyltransferase family 4 protein n=1 Tax=Pyxidicoccus xibeiensis TaxID=2906759 RepID=UPI0020A832DD|nr:glycosyltransferase [Pyxidicoccus xibeiensis]MCP3142513.1 glycosyltransferase [Pyxidicoccus xibeiensis]
MSDLPRLLLCSFDVIPGPSGSSRRVTEYLKALPDRFSVVVLSAKTPDHSHIEKYQGARLLRVPVGSGDLASRIQAFERAVRRQLESEEYALAHFTDPFGGYALCELKADYGYRLIYEAQTLPSQELRYTHPQTEGDRRFLSRIRRQELFCLMNADLIVTGSQTTRSYIQSLGASEDIIRVLRAPVDLQPYAPDALGAPDGDPLRLMYLGSQVGWQGLPTLLRALALAVKQVEVRLTLVGARHADWQPHLDDLVKELGLKDRVEFQAPVHHDDVAKVLALADVGVLPLDDVERNRLQGGPLAKVSEYFAAGRPVIAADLPVTRELIPAKAAVFFPSGDAQALAERIVGLARDIPRRVELGRQARAYAEEALDAGLIRGKLLDLYDSLLDKRSVPVAARSEDDLPSHTTVTGTPTNRLAALLPPEPTPISKPKTAPREQGSRSDSDEPSREELPLVMGQVLDEGLDTRLIKTELEAPSAEPPVVMGLPLRERDSSPTPATVVVGPELSELLSAKSSVPSRPVPPSRVDEPPAPTPTPTPTPIVRGPSTSTADEPPAPTPVVRAPEPAESEEPPAPTPVVRAPTGREEPPAPTPVVRAPTSREEPPAPTPVVRAPTSREEPPAPTPVVRAPTGRDETPTPTPVIKVPPPPSTAFRAATFTSTYDEPPAPTPIVKVPASLLMREDAPAPIRGGGISSRKDEPPAPQPPAPPRPVISSRSTSDRVETPSGRIPALSTPSRGIPALEPERPPPVPRPGSTTPETRIPALPPLIRGGTSTPEPERPPPVLRPGSAPSETSLPPIIRGGTAASSEPERPPALAPRAPALPPIPRQRPPQLTQSEPPRLEPSGAPPPRPVLPPSLKASLPSPTSQEDEPEEISADEAQPIDEGADGTATPAHSRPRLEEPPEISSDEVEEAEVSVSSAARLIEDEAELHEAEPELHEAEPVPEEEGPAPEPVPSSLNPWFAQLAHGYCPPDGIRFDRHTPPTTFPGRDEGTHPSPPPLAGHTSQGVGRGKSS